MKKGISFLWMLLFLVNCLQAQPTEKLTNSTILKMVKAKLSDDLIIGEINASETSFNVSPDSINYLTAEKVSPSILNAMRAAYEKQHSATLVEPELKTQVQQVSLPDKETVKEPEAVVMNEPVKKTVNEPLQSVAEKPVNDRNAKEIVATTDGNTSLSVEAMSYAIPITDMILYFDQEFTTLSGTINEWNEQAKKSLENDRQLRNDLSKVENNLADKKNADNKAFGNEIATLKNQRAVERSKVQQQKKKMLTEGMNITRKLKEMGNDMGNSINNKFTTVGNTIRSINTDPSTLITKPFTLTKQPIKEDVNYYIAPVTGLLHFCQNEMVSMKEMILKKNKEIVAINQKDIALARQMEPLQQKMTNLQKDAKKNKKEISALKKQTSELEKARKALSQEMEKNSKDLSKELEGICKVTQASLEERFTDIIDNITYLYEDSFTGY